jgi:hypothetical protein
VQTSSSHLKKKGCIALHVRVRSANLRSHATPAKKIKCDFKQQSVGV